jgi:hypothetical protein
MEPVRPIAQLRGLSSNLTNSPRENSRQREEEQMIKQNAFVAPFDSGQVPVMSQSTWTQLLLIDVSKGMAIVGIDIAVTGNPVNLLLTRTAKPGEQHVVFQTDFTKVGMVVCSATLGNPANASFLGNGTVNQPAAGDIASFNIHTGGCCELSIWAQAVSGPAIVRAYGKIPGIEL